MNDVVEYARECLGTPFRHQGRLCGVGLDCAGVVVHCATRLNIQHADMQGYPRLPYQNMLEQFMGAQPNLQLISWDKREPGDVVLMRIKAAPQHLGIYVGNDYMVHSYESIGQVVEQRIDDEWLKKIIAVYRFVR